MATIRTTYKGDMLFETVMGDHTLTIDVPAGMGGSDRGPTPPQVFIASIGSCVGALVADYCQRNDVDTRGMTVDVDFEKADKPTRLTNLKVTINMPQGECTKKRETVIRRVAEHCPVHETINTLEGIEFIINHPEPAAV
ncbi:MAG: OsmC family protein [Anaerolineales bacterium]